MTPLVNARSVSFPVDNRREPPIARNLARFTQGRTVTLGIRSNLYIKTSILKYSLWRLLTEAAPSVILDEAR